MKRREFLKLGGLSIFLGSTLKGAAINVEDDFLPVLIYDKSRCMDCKACMAACQLEKDLPVKTLLFKMSENEEGSYPHARLNFELENMCKECLHKPCKDACQYNAIKIEDSVVLIDENRCEASCAQNNPPCVASCPHDAIVIDGKAKKCDMCFSRITKGDIPRCAAVCPAGAIIYGNLKKPEGALKELLNNNPRLKYILLQHHHTFVEGAKYSNPYVYPEQNRPKTEKVAHTVCLDCNARCGLRVGINGNKIVQVDGNPYHPYNRSFNQITYDTPVKDSMKYAAGTCSKPQMVNDYINNPYRILKPLKRAGKRGEGKFVEIEWEDLINEIANGGKNFKHLGDDRYYPGIKDILSDEPIDKNAPELGPKRNQFVWFTGRSQGGRSHFIKRWFLNSVGSKNYIGHTDICGIGFRMGNYIFTDGREVELKADFENSKYMLIFGANIYSALQPGVATSGAMIARRVANGELKIVLVDPKAPKAVHVAHRWVPVKPTKDGALAMAMIKIMLKNGWYDEKFLKLASQKSAEKAGRKTYSNAAHLVITDGEHEGEILKASHLKKGSDEEIVIQNAKPVFASDADNPELFWKGEIEGFKCESVFSLLQKEVNRHSLEFYSKECGIDVSEIETLAREFWQNAPKSVAFAYHGGGNYVGGAYSSFAIAILNALVGNVNRKGGYLGKGKGAGKWREGKYDLKKFDGMLKPKGVKISREKAKYEHSSEFKKHGYPSKLPWFEFTKGGLSVSAISGIDLKYPYPAKIVFAYFSDFIYSMPGGYRFKQTLKDHNKVPLFVSIDTTVNETNIYADYIIPDITYMEGQYGFLTPHAPGGHFTGVRTPLIDAQTPKINNRPICLETFLIDLALKLNLPGYGEKAIKDKNGNYYPLYKAEDYYLRGIYNLALTSGVKGNKEDVTAVEKNYPVSRYKDMFSKDEWTALCSVVARGGVFKNNSWFDKNGNYTFGFEKIYLYNERLAKSTNTITGQKYYGGLKYPDFVTYRGKKLPEDGFNITTYKSSLHTQSRTICYERALFYEPDFELKVNPDDARRLGLKEGDEVIIDNMQNKKLKTKVKITNFVTEGNVAYSHHFGHWQHGASEIEIKNAKNILKGGAEVCKGDKVLSNPTRGVGITPNLITYLDKDMYDLPLLDLLGGIPDFSSTKVKIIKI
ncbi:molybdopterin oxidoreductase [Nautilia sp. PV-1]|uniref:molybdopterin-dependent oxidoreductase n=1 Tax=Nautilia sp. PV-1 TaxID=2579250 RepID=UPI000FD753BF|nr:molybdopterin-dependent oxidoreductase [Nautilia sp. PV-1]AZV46988.1 molybdopterin oxidoreductase [Nautilia sp. PV-1]